MTEKKLTKIEEAYYANIDKCALEAVDRQIKNSQPAHASYLMTKMFNIASDKVRLYSGKLVKVHEGVHVYSDNQLKSSLESFLMLKNKPVLEIAIQHDIDGELKEHPLIQVIENLKESKKLQGTVDIRKVESDVNNHFMVTDDDAYRLELDHEPCNAVANFNDKDTAKEISNFFDSELFSSGEKIYHS